MAEKTQTVADFAEALGVDAQKVYHWISTGQLRAVNTTREPNPRRHLWRIPADAAAEFINARQNPGPRPPPDRRRHRQSYRRFV